MQMAWRSSEGGVKWCRPPRPRGTASPPFLTEGTAMTTDPRHTKPYRRRRLRQPEPEPGTGQEPAPVCAECRRPIRVGRIVACGPLALHGDGDCLRRWRARRSLPLV
jgi:hypothetical protein